MGECTILFDEFNSTSTNKLAVILVLHKDKGMGHEDALFILPTCNYSMTEHRFVVIDEEL